MSNRIVEEIRELSVSKSLNILIGSGCSVGDKIGLMSKYRQEAKEENPGASEEKITESGNKKLLDAVIRASEEILKYPADFQKVKGNEDKVYTSYCEFVLELVNLLERSNSRQTPKNVNIFTTNYDLYIEKSVDSISRIKNFVFNDGTKGYFERILDGSSYNRLVSYKGLSDNYIDEIPSISLIKPHGSVNWKKIHAPDSDNYSVSITNYVNNEKMKGNTISKENVAKSLQEIVSEVLSEKVLKVMKNMKVNTILVSGGVSANGRLRDDENLFMF